MGEGSNFRKVLATHISVYKRFIDDILIVWKGNQKELNEFVTFIGANEYGIKFTLTT